MFVNNGFREMFVSQQLHWIFNFDFDKMPNSSQTYPENFV